MLLYAPPGANRWPVEGNSSMTAKAAVSNKKSAATWLASANVGLLPPERAVQFHEAFASRIEVEAPPVLPHRSTEKNARTEERKPVCFAEIALLQAAFPESSAPAIVLCEVRIRLEYVAMWPT